MSKAPKSVRVWANDAEVELVSSEWESGHKVEIWKTASGDVATAVDGEVVYSRVNGNPHYSFEFVSSV